MLKKFLIGTAVIALFALAMTVSAADYGTTTLRVGSKGAAVMAVQTLVGADVDGSFGPMTKAKVEVWQAANGLTADGVFGPASKAKANAGSTTPTVAGCAAGAAYNSMTGLPCTTVSTTLPAGCVAGAAFSSTTGAACTASTVVAGLTGTSGEIADINQLSQYSSEEVGDGSKDVKIMGFDVEATADGDIKLTSMKLTFDDGTTESGDSSRIEDYLTTVKVLMGSTVVGTASTADFTKDSAGIYSKTFVLSNVIVKAEAVEKFYVTVDAVGNLDSGDINSDSWTVGINNIRYVDGGGVTTTVDNADALLDGNMDYDAGGDGVPMSFVTFSSSANTELKITSNSTPEAQVVKISATDITENVVLLKGKMKLDGTSNVWLDELPITFTTNATNISLATSSVTLTLGSNTYTESTGTNCMNDTNFTAAETCLGTTTTAGVIFDNLDYTITAGSTVNFTVSADINEIAAGFAEGNTLLASLTATGRGVMVLENAQGEQLTDATEVSGIVTGFAQSFYSTGVSVANFTQSHSELTESGVVTKGIYTIGFSVTAFGNSYYMPKILENSALDADDTSGVSYSLYGDSGAATITEGTTTVTSSASALASTDATSSGVYFVLPEGETKHFTATINVIPGTGTRSPTSDFVSVQLGQVLYDFDTTASGDTAGSQESIYTITPAASYKTAGYSL